MKQRTQLFSNVICILISIFTLSSLVSCGENLSSSPGEKKLPVLKGSYLGQTPPGHIPQLFAPGIICTGMDDRDIAISPDGKEIFYGVLEKPHYVLIWLKEENNVWQPHKIAPFSGIYDDYEPQFSPDGNRLYFCSDRPIDGKGDPKDSDIWFVEREGAGWSEAKNLGSPVNTKKNEFYPSLTRSGTLYFTSHDMKICRCEYKDGKYCEPEILPKPVNTRAEYNAFIDPDENYLIFTSHSWGHQAGRGDLFVSYRKDNGSWTQPSHLGSDINSPAIEMSPTVSLDGKYLFFSSMRTKQGYDPQPTESFKQLLENFQKPQNKKLDIYWVDAKILKDMKPKDQKSEKKN